MADKIIEYSFYLLFFLVPLILTPFNYELFEYNKMMVTYAFTIIIIGSWIVKMIAQKEIRIKRTPLDIPLILFLLSQIVSTILSVDRHMSLFGYYSRFNGGLLSIISYILLYYAFVTNFPKGKIKKLLFIVISSGFLVSIYGILEHFGIDKNLWVQDVQNRVFSTLGQPNWLAAYLAVLIPIAMGFGINYFSSRNLIFEAKYQISNIKYQKENVKFKTIGSLGYWMIGLLVLITSVYYVTLVFTKSRSGFIGFWISLIVFWLFWLFFAIIIKIQSQKLTQMQAIARICDGVNRLIGIITIGFLLITFFLGSPFPQINRFTFAQLISKQQLSNEATKQSVVPIGSSIIDVGITESGTIRRIVWQGAIDIFKHYPIFGTGVETFALAYYKFRPTAHNMTSEWDFLYNKAHNEYLNYAATTGAFGLGSYLLIILIFIIYHLKQLNPKHQAPNSKQYQNKNDKNSKRFENSDFRHSNLFGIWNLEFGILQTALFSAWLSILVTNLFGFSVVIIQLFFFLIPAISFVLGDASASTTLFSFQLQSVKDSKYMNTNKYQLAMVFGMLIVICYMLYVLSRLWYADTVFARGYHLSHSSEPDYLASYKTLKQAISFNTSEPFYFDELAFPAAMLAVALDEEKLSTTAAELRDEAILANDIAVKQSPNNVNFWKTRTRVFYTLTVLDEKYLNQAKEALIKAQDLAPTDPKISYNLALIYDRLGEKQKAFDLLWQTTKLKPDYKEAYLALGLLYQEDKQKEKAKEAFNFVLTRLDPNDEIAKQKMEELK